MINFISSDIVEYIKLLSVAVGIGLTILFFTILFMSDND